MIIFPCSKSTKCYGDTVIRRAVDTWVYKMEKVTINKQKKLSLRKCWESYILLLEGTYWLPLLR